jgi:surfactin family lipopeptide synthetase A
MSSPDQRTIQLSEKRRALFDVLRRKQGNGASITPRIPRRKETDQIPLSFAQQRLWFVDQWDPGSPVYNIRHVLRLSGPLNVRALERSLNEIVRRHEVLRTRFPTVDGLPVQQIESSLTLPLPVVDLRHLPVGQREEEAQRLAREEAKRSFDLAHGPLLRATCLQLGDEEQILVLTMHHIVSDGWSMGVLYRELGALYNAFSAGEPSPLPELPIQYADYTLWQREWLQGEFLQKQRTYWKQQLQGAPELLELPTDRPRPSIHTFEGARQWFILPRGLTEAIQSLGQQEGATLFMALLAAFQVLLHRNSGQNEIVVGTPIANRGRVETEGLIGYFGNNLVLRTDLSENPTFRELLGRVREVALGAYAHQDLPFEKLIEELQPKRNLSHTPLFQVMFQVQNTPREPLELSGLAVSLLPVEMGAAKFDLMLSLVDTCEGMRGTLQYNTQLFDPATIQRMLGQYQTLLEGIVAHPDQPIAQLPLLTPEQRHQLLVAWNSTDSPYPRDTCLHTLFEQQVRRSPDALALCFQGETLTYAQLNRRANQLAHYLRARGVGPEVRVGVCLERSLALIVGVLGILKAGGAYVPLDPASPAERLAFQLQDAQIPLLLTEEGLLPQLPPSPAQPLCLDRDWSLIATHSDQDPLPTATPEDLAYVIYTSGSTGRPKGVMVPNRALVNYACAACSTYALRPTDRVLQFASLCFDASAEEIFPTLLTGATLVLRSPAMLDSVATFLNCCEAWGLTVLSLPTAYWHELAGALAAAPRPLPAALRLVIIGGERVLPERWAAWQASVGDSVRLVNTYGPTEATIVATMSELSTSARMAAEGELPIGRPIANVKAYVLDRWRQPVPMGVPGELYLGGAGVARGYLNRPELTAERFLADPFSPIPNGRLYRTGDRVRFRADGELEYLGRLDDQVKLRGYRIELGEIEAVLAQHPQVRECAVLARAAAPGEQRLAAYVVAKEGAGLAVGELRGYLQGKLPGYMVPVDWKILAALPRTASGKVDRPRLPEPERGGERRAERVAPRSAVEGVVAEIWAGVLGLEEVGVEENFFELGGHSLVATQVVARVEQTLGVALPLRRLFETPTVAGLAASLLQESDSQTALEERAQILLDLARLSEEEVAMMLDQGCTSLPEALVS